jgi:hypothetical protein
METSDSKLVKRLAESLTGVIVSLAVFACVFAVIVLHLSKDGLENNVFWFICGLAGLSLIGFIVFLLVARARTEAKNSKSKQQITEEISLRRRIITSIKEKSIEEKSFLNKIPGSITKITEKEGNQPVPYSEQIVEIIVNRLEFINKIEKEIDSQFKVLDKKANKEIKKQSKIIKKLEKKLEAIDFNSKKV